MLTLKISWNQLGYLQTEKLTNFFEFFWFSCRHQSNNLNYFYCVIYHPPPRPQSAKLNKLPDYFYEDISLIEQLLGDVEDIAISNPGAVISIIGDINHLDTSRFESEAGMTQLVRNVTHQSNILDKFITNQPDLFLITVTVCSIKTNHKAVTANLGDVINNRSFPSGVEQTTVTFPDIRLPNIQLLRNTLACYNWGAILASDDGIDLKYDLFHVTISRLIELSIPHKSIPFENLNPGSLPL